MSGLFSSIGNAIGGVAKGIGNIFTGGQGQTAQQSATLASPFQSQYGRYQNQLYNLVSNPSSVTSTPGYQFQYDQGLQALERTLASTGELSSGKAMTAAEQYGQGYATSSLQQQESLLSGLSGAGFGNPGAAGSLFSQNQGGVNSFLSNLLGNSISFLGGSNGISSWFGGGSVAGNAANMGLVDSGMSDIGAVAPEIGGFTLGDAGAGAAGASVADLLPALVL